MENYSQLSYWCFCSMKVLVLHIIILTICVLIFIPLVTSKNASKRNNNRDETTVKRKRPKKSKSRPTQEALLDWVHSLIPEKDYNATYWCKKFHSRSTQDFFFKYVEQLTNIFVKKGAIVNFASIGACDGISDPTIKYQFLKYPNWRGVFVEPMSNNFRDLEDFMASKGALNRSFLLRAAATEICQSPTIVVERPMYEEQNSKNRTIPHWLRRQIGSILPNTRTKARPNWTTEEVRCVTAKDILTDWYKNVTGSASVGFTGKQTDLQLIKSTASRVLRPHILKIDVEGHDYQVLMSFLLDSTPIRELPLLVEFEAKSIAEKFPAAKARMEQRGYVVSDYAQDGFALLKGDIILQGMGMDTLTDGSDMDSNVALERRNNRKRGRGQKSIDGGVSNELTGIETDKVVDFSYATDGTRAPKIATTHDGYIEPD